jgi:outer membrane protein assembly factor BamB
VWTVDTAKKFGVIQNFFGVSSNPVIHDDKIIVMVGGSPEESAQVPKGQLDRVKPNGSAIVAFDRLTGKIKYKTGNDLASYSSLTWLKTKPNKTLLAWCRGSALGIDPNDGRVKFKFPWRARKLESVNAMTPVVDNSRFLRCRFLLSECYELGSAFVEVQDDQCNVVWSDRGRRKKSLAAHWGTPVLHQGYVYGSSGRHSSNADLRCVELATGDVKWMQRGFGRGSVTLVGDNLVVLGERGRLALVKATQEEFRLITERAPTEEFSLEPDCWAAPIVSGGRLYVRGGKKVGCFQLFEVP